MGSSETHQKGLPTGCHSHLRKAGGQSHGFLFVVCRHFAMRLFSPRLNNPHLYPHDVRFNPTADAFDQTT